jgi:hypothetical protein
VPEKSDGPTGDISLRFALVENHLRYGGENGIRFHPMVVRAISGPTLVPPGHSATAEETFDVAAIAGGLKAYLDGYEARNDRFGPITFVEKKDGIDPDGLTVVAFLQRGHDQRVLQTAILRLDRDRLDRSRRSQ